jgi:hypothetical protein
MVATREHPPGKSYLIIDAEAEGGPRFTFNDPRTNTRYHIGGAYDAWGENLYRDVQERLDMWSAEGAESISTLEGELQEVFRAHQVLEA